MTTSISERANAYRAALRQALNDGLSMDVANELAQKAARDASNLPPQKLVVLTDEELRLIPEHELTAEECDRLLELEQLKDVAEMEAFNATLPSATPKSDVVRELAEALGYRVINLELVREDLGGLIGPDGMTNDELSSGTCNEPSCVNARKWAKRRAMGAEKKLSDAAEFNAELCDCEFGGCGSECKGIAVNRGNPNWEQRENPAVTEHRAESERLTLADKWRDGVGIETPAHLKLTGRAHFMAGLGIVDHMVGDLAAEKLAGPENTGALDDGPNCVSGFPGPGVLADLEANKPVRDCDIPATLRAVDIPSTGFNDSIQRWFDGDDEMQQFLAGRCLYADADRSIKDEEGDLVGMWFYAHFGPTPVS